MSALDIQIGGEHYKNAKIQPVQYIEANGLGFLEGCVVKRITRHDKPTGKGRQDIEKAIHELQLLLEFRYPQAQDRDDPFKALAAAEALSAHNQRVAPPLVYFSTPNSPSEDIYAEFAARTGTHTTFHERVAEIDMSVQRAVDVCLARGAGLPADMGATCPECGYPTDAAGTHYATCSQLTAPEEYKAEAQVAFDEAAEISEALARKVSGGTAGHMIRPPKEVLAEVSDAWRRACTEEPAAAMDDDSPRMQAIGQNGNEGEHYDDPFAGAPLWANYRAQDADGEWFHYSHEPVPKDEGLWVRSDAAGNDCEFHTAGEPNPNWRDTLITRT